MGGHWNSFWPATWWAWLLFATELLAATLMLYVIWRTVGTGRIDHHLRMRRHERNYRLRVWTREILDEHLGEANRLWSDPVLRSAEHQVALRIARDRNTAPPTLRAVPSVSSDPREGYALGDPKRLAFEGKLL